MTHYVPVRNKPYFIRILFSKARYLSVSSRWQTVTSDFTIQNWIQFTTSAYAYFLYNTLRVNTFSFNRAKQDYNISSHFQNTRGGEGSSHSIFTRSTVLFLSFMLAILSPKRERITDRTTVTRCNPPIKFHIYFRISNTSCD